MSISSTRLSSHYQPSKMVIQCWIRHSCCTSWNNASVIKCTQWHCITILINLYSKASVSKPRLYGLVYTRISTFRSRSETPWAGNKCTQTSVRDRDSNMRPQVSSSERVSLVLTDGPHGTAGIWSSQGIPSRHLRVHYWHCRRKYQIGLYQINLQGGNWGSWMYCSRSCG